ncbi:MAG TPA: cytochrome c family protein [Bacteroidota bacterium]|nr:cytochrome c family protein [Bacteroidota bacterium]
MTRFTSATLLAGLIFGLSSLVGAQNKYVGIMQCKMCHNTEKQGKHFDIWSKSKHAEAYKTLLTKAADSIAAKKGFKTKAVETPECLGCHTITADAKLLDKKFDVKDGVQCESCHGPGSEYKNMAVMKDPKKAEAAGLHMFADSAATAKLCVTCHNEKSPVVKKFDYAKMWPMIEHKTPKK